MKRPVINVLLILTFLAVILLDPFRFVYDLKIFPMILSIIAVYILLILLSTLNVIRFQNFVFVLQF